MKHCCLLALSCAVALAAPAAAGLPPGAVTSLGNPRFQVSIPWLRFSGDGRTLLMPVGSQLIRADVKTGKHLSTLEMGTWFAVSDDGRLVIDRSSEAKRLSLKEVATGKTLPAFRFDTPDGVPYRFSPDARHLLVRSQGSAGRIQIVEVATCKQRHLFEPPVGEAVFSPDGRLLAGTGCDVETTNGSVCRLWDPLTGAVVREMRTGSRCLCAAFSPDGRLLATGGWDQSLQIWETATGKQVCSWRVSRAHVDRLAFSPDGRTLALAEQSGAPDRAVSIQLRDVDEGTELRRLGPPGDYGVASLAWSPDGSRLASGNWMDGTILVWGTSSVQARARPAEVRPTPGQCRRLWADLADGDAGKARAALRALARAPQDTTAFLAEQLPGRAKERPDGKRLDRLIGELDSDHFATRERASAELTRVAEEVEGVLRKRLAQGGLSLEVSLRLKRILGGVEEGVVPPSLRRWLRATEVLERIGTPQARRLLEKLAAQDDPVAVEAKASLARLGRTERR